MDQCSLSKSVNLLLNDFHTQELCYISNKRVLCVVVIYSRLLIGHLCYSERRERSCQPACLAMFEKR